MRWLGPALGYLLAAVGLVWVLYDIRFEKPLGHLTKINWWWVALATRPTHVPPNTPVPSDPALR
jgi:hypothetical protein